MCRRAVVKLDLSPPTSLRTREARVHSSCHCRIIRAFHRDLKPDLELRPPLMELGGRTIERARICDHLLARRRRRCRLCSGKGRDMGLEVDLPLGKLYEDLVKVRHRKGLVAGSAGRGLLTPSVTVGASEGKGAFVGDVVGDRGYSGNVNVNVEKDSVVDEVVTFDLVVPLLGTETFEAGLVVQVRERAGDDVDDPLVLVGEGRREVWAGNGDYRKGGYGCMLF